MRPASIASDEVVRGVAHEKEAWSRRDARSRLVPAMKAQRALARLVVGELLRAATS